MKLSGEVFGRIPGPAAAKMNWLFQSAVSRLSICWEGNGVECPVCRGQFRSFLPYGRFNLRWGALCPRCFSLERHRVMWMFIKGETDLLAVPKSLLHVAPESCFRSRFRELKGLDYVTGDLLSKDVDINFDIAAIPFEEARFDVVLANHVLEHVPDDRGAMKQVFRVLKPGGWALLQVPLDWARAATYEDVSIVGPRERMRAFGQADHVRWYGRDYVERLEEAGFLVELRNIPGEVGVSEALRLGLDLQEVVFACRKPPAGSADAFIKA